MFRSFSISDSDVLLLENLIDELPAGKKHLCFLLDRMLDDALDGPPFLIESERAELEALARSALPGLSVELEVLDRLLGTLLEYEP